MKSPVVDQPIGEGALDRRTHRGEIEVTLSLGERGLQFDELRAGFVLLRLGHLDIVARGVGGGLRRFHRGKALVASGFRDFERGARGESLGAERLLTVEVEPGPFQRSLGRNQLRLGLFGGAFHCGDLAADPVDGGLLGRDLRARGIDRDAIIAVVDPEDHVTLADHDVVAGKDRGDVAGHPGAKRGVVGAHIGVIGGDVEASDQNIIRAVAGRGERQQRADADHDPSPPARFRRVGAGGGRRAGCWFFGCRFAGCFPGVAGDGLFRDRGKRGIDRDLARERAFRRIWFGTKDTRGLVSRCGHYGFPITYILTIARGRYHPTGPRAAIIQITLTERFGQDTSQSQSIKRVTGIIAYQSFRGIFSAGNLSREAKPMVAPNPPSLRLVGDEDSSKRRQILDGAGKVFMDLGFDGASMGEIARSAGVSKGTLYVYFADKNRLFEAIVEEEALEQGKAAFNFDSARDVTTTLLDFGQAYIQLLCRPRGGSALRTVMAIAERMPEVGRRFYTNVIALTIARTRRLSRTACRVGRPCDRGL